MSLQLRARDGLIDRNDYLRMRAQMSLDDMPAERRQAFFEPDVYSLVTTRKKRHAANLKATDDLLDKGNPGIRLDAIHCPANSPATVAFLRRHRTREDDCASTWISCNGDLEHIGWQRAGQWHCR